MRQKLKAVLGLVAIVLAVAGRADGQVIRYPTGYGNSGTNWYGYTQGSPWVTYAPNGWAGYTAGTAPRYAAPAPTSGGWDGYTPNAWYGYNPGQAWRGYAPAVTAAPAAPAPATTPSITPHYGRMGHAYREFGSGRGIPLHKPWLPGSP
jgi:hypothetical protein